MKLYELELLLEQKDRQAELNQLLVKQLLEALPDAPRAAEYRVPDDQFWTPARTEQLEAELATYRDDYRDASDFNDLLSEVERRDLVLDAEDSLMEQVISELDAVGASPKTTTDELLAFASNLRITSTTARTWNGGRC